MNDEEFRRHILVLLNNINDTVEAVAGRLDQMEVWMDILAARASMAPHNEDVLTGAE